jgi:hypothetical protein
MKKIAIVALLGVFIATGAFAELAIGVNGALYMDDSELNDSSYGSVADRFQDGEGIYYGLFIEALGRKAGFGAAFNASKYASQWDPEQEMMDMDLNLYFSYHLIKATSVIDPFGEIGLGYIAKDYVDAEYDDDHDNPLTASTYWFAGGGLGINLGFIGVFAKFNYLMPFGNELTGTVSYVDEEGETQETEITLESFALKPYRVVIGAKLIL